jgi:hypothetical protein
MDGGANICVTGNLSSLVGIVDIPPMPITVALAGDDTSMDYCCTKRGYHPLTLNNGSIYWLICFYCANVVETIISPQAVLASSNMFTSWTQTGYKDNQPGSIRFDSNDGHLLMALMLECHDGLYYCHTDIYTVDPTEQSSLSPLPLVPTVARVVMPNTSSSLWRPSQYVPTSKSKQLESKLCILRLGSPRVTQLDILPGNAVGIPAEFDHHPFWFIDFKAQAQTRKQAAQRLAIWTTERKHRFHMDFGFMWALAFDFSWANRSKDHVILSYDGFSSYLLIVDEASCYIWVFFTHSKEPPLDNISKFL